MIKAPKRMPPIIYLVSSGISGKNQVIKDKTEMVVKK